MPITAKLLPLTCDLTGYRTRASETLERSPTCVRLGRGLQGCRQVDEQVESGPCLYLVYAGDILGVAVTLTLQIFMREPKTYGGGGCDRRTAPCDLEQGLPIVVGDRQGLAVAGVYYGIDGLAAAFLPECSARDHIDRVAARSERADRCLEVIPDAAVESVLDLRGDVGHVVGLVRHAVVHRAVRVRNLMPARVEIAIVIGRGDIHSIGPGHGVCLLRVWHVRVIGPVVIAARSQMRRAQRVCHPIGGIHLRVIEAGVVALGATAHARRVSDLVQVTQRRSGGAAHSSRRIRRHLEQSRGDEGCGGRGRERAFRSIDRFAALDDVGLVVVRRARKEVRQGPAERRAAPVSVRVTAKAARCGPVLESGPGDRS